MIYIIDNQKPHSDHELFFVDSGGLTHAQMIALIILCAGPHPTKPWIVAGTAKDINWIDWKVGAVDVQGLVNYCEYGPLDWWEDGSPNELSTARALMRVLPSAILWPESLKRVRDEKCGKDCNLCTQCGIKEK